MISYYRKSISSIIKQLGNIQSDPIHSVQLCLHLQETLIQKITYFESRIKKLKKKKKNLRYSLTFSQSREISNQTKKEIEDIQQWLSGYKQLIFIYKSFGDSLAHIFIPREDIDPISFNRPSGYISNKKGMRLERKIFRSIFRHNKIAILNDLTNCLRNGDITLITNKGYSIIEVKSGKTIQNRDIRQKERLDKISKYLSSDKIIGLYNLHDKTFRVNNHSKIEDHISTVNELANKAKRDKFALSNPEPGLYYLFFADNYFEEREFISFLQSVKEPLLYFVSLSKYEATNYKPFALIFNSHDLFIDYYMGKMQIFVLISKQYIRELLLKNNMTIEFFEDQDFLLEIKPVNHSFENGAEFIRISNKFFGKVAFEFTSLDWILNEIIHHSKKDLRSITS